MAYRALYREWRPVDFSHVVGQSAVIETLRNQVIAQRIAHAYLFCGSRGTGKTSTAKILAKAINCLNPVNGDPCGECENCRRLDHEETLDVIEIDAASNNGVDEMRELRDTVKYPPQFGKYKVYIIDEVHMLSTSAFNALLKTLEEPPAHIVFILATTEPQKLPATILSRCQRFDFGRLSVSEISGRLKEAAQACNAVVSDGALMQIARAADGGMRDALSILDMCLGYSNNIDENLVRNILGTSGTAFLFDYCDAFAQNDLAKILSFIDQLMRDGKDPAVFAKDVCRHIRALLITKISTEDCARILEITSEDAEAYRRQSEQFTLSRLMTILDLYLSLESDMRYSATPRFALENASLKCCLQLEQTDNQALSDRITELEKRITEITEGINRGERAVIRTGAEDNARASKSADATHDNAVRSFSKKEEPPREGLNAWNEMMNRFKRTEPSLWSFLSQGHLVSSTDFRFIWQANQSEGERVFLIPLNKSENKKKIADCLSQITGQSTAFQAAERNQAVSQSADNDDEYLQRLYETFGSEPVDVVEKI